MLISEDRNEWIKLVNAFFDGELQFRAGTKWNDIKDDICFDGTIDQYRIKPKNPLTLDDMYNLMKSGQWIGGYYVASMNKDGCWLKPTSSGLDLYIKKDELHTLVENGFFK